MDLNCLREIATNFINSEEFQLHNESLDYYAGVENKSGTSDVEAIERAALSRSRAGRCDNHQNKIGFRKLNIAAEYLLEHSHDILKLARAKRDFDKLYNLISSYRDGIRERIIAQSDVTSGHSTSGVGPLWIYDVSLRIGWRFSILPNRVYLHTGALEGARILLNSRRVINPLPMEQLPLVIREALSQAYQVETFLCNRRNEIELCVLGRDSMDTSNKNAKKRKRPGC